MVSVSEKATQGCGLLQFGPLTGAQPPMLGAVGAHEGNGRDVLTVQTAGDMDGLSRFCVGVSG